MIDDRVSFHSNNKRISPIKVTNTICPGHADQGCDVPVAFELDQMLGDNQSLLLMINGQPALRVMSIGNASFDYLATRLRLKSNSDLSLEFNDQSQQFKLWQDKVSVRDGCQIPSVGSTSHRVRRQYQNDKLFIMTTNDMPLEGYIRQLSIKINQGEIVVEPTPFIKEGCFLGFHTNFTMEEATITASV